MNARRFALAGTLLIVVGAAVFGWYKLVLHPPPVVCGYCSRLLHANLTVTAEIAGKRAQVCCARCAISQANQERKTLRLISVSDYPSGRSISPTDAWYVEGSRATACDHDAMRMNEMKGADMADFDRCSPGTFAFVERAAADAFAAKNGGAVLSLTQLMTEAKFQ